jgi:hypothetical protein
VTSGTALILLGFGLGALAIMSQDSTRTDPRALSADDQLRERAIEAQRASATAARRARELTTLWLEQCARLSDQRTLEASGQQR